MAGSGRLHHDPASTRPETDPVALPENVSKDDDCNKELEVRSVHDHVISGRVYASSTLSVS